MMPRCRCAVLTHRWRRGPSGGVCVRSCCRGHARGEFPGVRWHYFRRLSWFAGRYWGRDYTDPLHRPAFAQVIRSESTGKVRTVKVGVGTLALFWDRRPLRPPFSAARPSTVEVIRYPR